MEKHKINGLAQTALQIFDAEVIDKTILMLVDNVFKQLMAEQAGEVIDRSAIKTAISRFRKINMTKVKIVKNEKGDLDWEGQRIKNNVIQDFDKEYIKKFIDYFEKESKLWIVNMSSPEYAKKGLEVLKREEDNAKEFIESNSQKIYGEKLLDVIVKQNSLDLVSKKHSGAKELISQKHIEDLNCLTRLLMKVPDTIPLMTKALSEYIKFKGKELEEDKKIVENPITYISNLLELKREVNSMIIGAFENISNFKQDSDHAFKSYLSDFQLAPKFLAIYIDYMMRVDLKGKDSEAEKRVSEVFEIFKLLSSKDAFCQEHQVRIHLIIESLWFQIT